MNEARKKGGKLYKLGNYPKEGLSNELCNLGFHSAPNGTRSSPNITWKLCSAGFQ
jgi:hypothetical protein